VTDDVSARLIRLPFFTNMEPDETEAVIAAVREFTVKG
jgi:dTDP-4-amino-4,6-dideoxygalactose transaminase